MTTTKNPIATDSAAELRKVVGEDSTSTFESDPAFVDANPAGSASSENIEVQRDTDDSADGDEELDDLDAAEDEGEEDEEEEEVEAEANYQRT